MSLGPIWNISIQFFEIEDAMGKAGVESTCTYFRSPNFDVTRDLHDSSYREFQCS